MQYPVNGAHYLPDAGERMHAVREACKVLHIYHDKGSPFPGGGEEMVRPAPLIDDAGSPAAEGAECVLVVWHGSSPFL